MNHDLFNTIREFDRGTGEKAKLYSLPELKKGRYCQNPLLPGLIHVVLGSVLHNYDSRKMTEHGTEEIPRSRYLSLGIRSFKETSRRPLVADRDRLANHRKVHGH